MQHIKITFKVRGQEETDILIALLLDAGFSGFEEADNGLLAYIEATEFAPDALEKITGALGIGYEKETIAPQNWNALWESNFQPVIVDGYCTIRAHFHDIEVNTPYEIIITPKMSFGTGHHATTQLMIQLMRGIDVAGKTVLDFGTGTGVLAILADMLGATSILAIDNDAWPVENAIENAMRNNCEHISVQLASLEGIAGDATVDIILANINRHILLQYMEQLYQKLNPNGSILMSGLLTEDKDIIINAAAEVGFQFQKSMEKNNWIALLFVKQAGNI